MGEPLDDLELIRDPAEVQRRLIFHVRELGQNQKHMAVELAQIRDAMPAKRPTWIPAMLGIIMTLLLTYIGLVHQVATRARDTIQSVEQRQLTSLHYAKIIDDLEQRLRGLEAVAYVIPQLKESLGAVDKKLDKLLEQ